MKKAVCLAAAVAFWAFGQAAPMAAQQPEHRGMAAQRKPEAKPETKGEAPKEVSVTTEHSVRIGGQEVPYKATVGSILIKNDEGDPTALIYYTAYTRTDVKDLSHRPLSFLYNGGPGSSSIWVHMGAYGPRRVVTTDAAPSGAAPYQIVDNQSSLLDKSDLVFIDPVGTGFSHAVGKAKDKDFWGVDEDVHSLAKFVMTYVTRNDRWNSPKFLIGESYGTFRSVALGNYLQSHDGMYLNGIVLMSSVLDLGTISFYPGEDLAFVLYVPSYAATAYYHHVLTPEPSNLDAFLQQARQFAETKYADALLQGDKLSATDKAAIAKELAHFTGLSEDYLLKADLRVALPQFMAELQRKRELATGRLDSRFSGPTPDPLAEYSFYDPQSVAITGAFTAAWHHYLRDELNYKTDDTYHVAANGAGRSWDWKHNAGRGYGFPGSPNVEPDLVQALITNPHLQIEVENGYYDLATPFFETEYTMDHLGLPAKLRSHIQLKYYESGHMMYVHEPSLVKLKANVGAFIDANAK
jgi:carboxypeptidase C (cathepsin A)